MTPTTTPQQIKVQLTLQARRLRNVAGAFKGTSDPYCVVTQLANDHSQQPVVLGKTEVIKNSLNPAWTTAFTLEYEFGIPLNINVGIYDEVRKSKHKSMGSALFEVGEVLGSKGNVKAKSLKPGGVVYARIQQPSSAGSGTLSLQLKGKKLRNVDGLFGKSDPFFEISSRLTTQVSGVSGHSWQVVYRSKPQMNNLNPDWPAVELDLERLCSSDKSRPILVSVWDWEKSGRHTPMGNFETSVQGLQNAVSGSTNFELKRRGKSFGSIVVTKATVDGGGGSSTNHHYAQTMTATPIAVPMTTTTPQTPPFVAAEPIVAAAAQSTNHNDPPPFSMALDNPPPRPVPAPAASAPVVPNQAIPIGYNLPNPTPNYAPPQSFYAAPPKPKPNFVDYISGGCELQLCIAIDFTGSNGDPRRPGTLHYIHKDGQLNDYEKALTAVGSIVGKYDSDQKFPVWGFGAKYGGVLRNVFQVGPSPELEGLGAVLEAYRGVFTTPITLSGPTVFDEVIAVAAAQARSSQAKAASIGKQTYTILLILTDGAVSNVQATKQALIQASDAPLSVVIVGIGNADFGAMQFLDDFAQGSTRDICQFVEFRQHQHNRLSLTRATLDEIPSQLVEYFYEQHGIMPLPPISGSKMSLVEADSYNQDEDIDLSLNIGEQEISLANANQAVHDETKYGTISDYSNVPVLPPPSAPSSAPTPYNPSANAPAPYNPSANVPAPYNPSANAPYNPSQQQQQEPPNNVFHVQAPPGTRPGMQIRVQHPTTKRNLLVTIPQGVPPGGTFAVSYL